MLRSASQSRRTWVLLLALFILGGISWADTFDLSDDVLLPSSLTVVQQAIVTAEESREDIFGWMEPHCVCYVIVPQMRPVFGARFSSPHSELSLYLLFSTYRI